MIMMMMMVMIILLAMMTMMMEKEDDWSLLIQKAEVHSLEHGHRSDLIIIKSFPIFPILAPSSFE